MSQENQQLALEEEKKTNQIMADDRICI